MSENSTYDEAVTRMQEIELRMTALSKKHRMSAADEAEYETSVASSMS